MSKLGSILIALALTLGLTQAVSRWAGAAEIEEEDTCCVCISEGCCLTIDAEHCTPDGTFELADVVRDLLDSLQIDAQAFCDTCDACAESPLSPEEDRRYLDICDLCVFEPVFESRSCESLSAPILEDDGGCTLSRSAGGGADGTTFLLAAAWMLGMAGWKIGRGCKDSFTRSRWP
ncbi:MAG TPA: hypothetical protein VJP40_04480 [bacterium]|nr:hypothetical protein [bacterium]